MRPGAALLSASLLVVVPAAIAQAGDPPGLVSRYEAEGSPNDGTATGNNTVAVGNVTYGPGAIGQGFVLDGASYLNLGFNTFDHYAAGFTVTAWIRIDAYSNPASAINLRTAANTSGFTLEQLFGHDGTLTFGVNQSGVFDDYPRVDAAGWKTGVLYHVAATFDAASGSIVLYRDGKAVAWRHDLARKSMAVATDGDDFQIGHNIRATTAFWRGLIDDVRFYGRALSPAEVASIWRRSSLVAHWRFDEQPGATVARDDLGSHDGTLAGGATFAAGGISGNCVSLDKATNSLVNMGASFPAFTSGDFSVVGWLKTTSIPVDSLLVSRHEAFVSNGYLVAVSATGGGGSAGRATFYASDAQVAQSPVSTTPIDDGAWHQIVGVYRAGGSHSVFVDGAPAESSTPSATVVDRGAPFLVGGVKENGSPASRLTGLVDDVQVYASALTDAQIDYLFAHPGRELPAVQYDLRTDWSDDANSNGAWIYREGMNALPHLADWAHAPDFDGAQPAWARSASATGTGGTFIPAWFKSVTPTNPDFDWLAGDVVVHTTSPDNGVGNGPANVVWTAPFAGVVDVSGAVWPGRSSLGRGNDWFVYRNDTLLTQGTLGSSDPYDRAHPFELSTGSGGAVALSDVAVAPGDTLRLEFTKTATSGEFVGVEFSVSVAPGGRVLSYFLPKSVKLKLAGAGKDSLTVSGFFDDGGATVDLTRPVTIEVGGYSTGSVTLDAKGSHKDANLSLTLKPRLKGSSRGSFKLTLKKTTLANLVDPSGEVELHLSASGLPDAVGRVRLTKGNFALGKAPGTLVEPALFPVKATVTANDAKPDALTLTAGFATDGTTPAALTRVRIALGPVFDRVIDGSAFTKSGDVFTHTETVAGGGSLTVTVNFATELVTVKSKGVEVGPLTDPTVDLVVDVGTDAGPVTNRIRLGAAGAKRSY